MSEFVESIFDTVEDGFTQWQRDFLNESIEDDQIIHKGKMMKYSRESQSYKKRFFILTKDKLYCVKSLKCKKIRGWMSTKWVRVDYRQSDDHYDDFGFKFIKNMKYSDFMIKGMKRFNKWYEAFCKVFV